MNPANENQKVTFKHAPTRKRQPSKLDPFSEPLLQMDAEKKSLQEMMAWLNAQGIETATSNLAHFLARRRAKQLLDTENNLLEGLQEWLEQNPHATLEVVSERFKLLALSLSMQPGAAPEVLKLADKLVGTVSRLDYRERRLVMEEENHLEAKKTTQAKALELCLVEAKKFPEVGVAFQAAFDAWDKAEGIT